jgi:4-diphosphocytidyl-2-C-methyl-D-erythritol kinase
VTATDRVEVEARAKVNLLLRVLSREAAGYHGIETVFVLIETSDRLTVERTGNGIDLVVSGAETGPVEENLAYRAAAAVLRASGASFGVRIHLEKSIPVRAGLGGGSSDAAATLKAVNELAGNLVPPPELFQLGAGLGADVPFFVSGARMALGWNRGERLFRLKPPPSAPCLLAVPTVGMGTQEAYERLDVGRDYTTPRATVMLDETAFERWGNIARLGGNDFESVVFAKEPAVRTLFERIAETNPLLVRMTGSGSTVFAIYRRERDLDDAMMTIGTREQKLIKTRTL